MPGGSGETRALVCSWWGHKAAQLLWKTGWRLPQRLNMDLWNRVWWHTPATLQLEQGQSRLHSKFKTSLGYTRPCLKDKQTSKHKRARELTSPALPQDPSLVPKTHIK